MLVGEQLHPAIAPDGTRRRNGCEEMEDTEHRSSLVESVARDVRAVPRSMPARRCRFDDRQRLARNPPARQATRP